MAGTELFTHIRAMMATTIPSILITLGIYFVLGLRATPAGAVPEAVGEAAIDTGFHTGILTMIPLLVVIVLAVRKVHPTIAILAGAVTGWSGRGDSPARNGQTVRRRRRAGHARRVAQGVWSAMATGFTADTGVPRVDELLSGGGMEGMLGTVWLIVAALTFGGIMNHCGFLARLIEPLRKRAQSPRAMMAATGATAIGVNVVAAERYLAIVLTGNIYKSDFEKRGIAPQSLSRQIEDTATVTSVLVPWNSCGAYAAGVLRVATVTYLLAFNGSIRWCPSCTTRWDGRSIACRRRQNSSLHPTRLSSMASRATQPTNSRPTAPQSDGPNWPLVSASPAPRLAASDDVVLRFPDTVGPVIGQAGRLASPASW